MQDGKINSKNPNNPMLTENYLESMEKRSNSSGIFSTNHNVGNSPNDSRETGSLLGGASRSGDSSRGIRERRAPRRGVSSSFLFSSVMVTGDLDEGGIGGAERDHAIVCQIYGMPESAAKASCSDCPTPTPTRRPGRPAEVSAVIAWHRGAAALETANQEHMELAAAGAVPARRSTRRPCGETTHSSQATRTGEQRPKGQRRRANLDWVVIFMMLAQLALATVHGSSRDIKAGGPCLFH